MLIDSGENPIYKLGKSKLATINPRHLFKMQMRPLFFRYWVQVTKKQ